MYATNGKCQVVGQFESTLTHYPQSQPATLDHHDVRVAWPLAYLAPTGAYALVHTVLPSPRFVNRDARFSVRS